MPATAPSLFSPIVIRGLAIRNRLWVSPMCQWMAGRDGRARTWHVVNYGQYAAGGAGLVTVEASAVSPAGRIATGDLGLWEDAQVDGLRQVVDAIVQCGAVPAIQIGHAGRKGSATGIRWLDADPGFAPDPPERWDTLGPSAIPNAGMPAPKELTVEQIGEVVGQFAAAARRAACAGFTVLDIHAAHGYLLHQFLSAVSNRRTDGYGGSLTGRARLLREVVRAIRAEVGDGIVLFVRFSATDWIDGGWDLTQTVEVARLLAEDGVDLLDVSTGGMDNPPVPVGPGYQVPFAQALRQATGLPVSAVGMISEAAQAAQILVTGQADAVMVGRAWMRNPHLGGAWAADLGVSDPQRIVAPPYSMARWGK